MNWKVLFVLLITLSLTSVYAQTYYQDDLDALLAIDATCDTNNQLNWNTEPDPENWNGVNWDASAIKRVFYLQLNEKQLTGFMDVSPLSNLRVLSCYNNQLTGLNTNGLANLDRMDCSYNQLSELYIENLVNLSYLNCNDNRLTELDVKKLTSLTQLECEGNGITILDIGELINLTDLKCTSNQLTELDVDALTNLINLSCGRNQITELDIKNLAKLTILYCYSNQLSVLEVSNLTNLIVFCCSSNALTDLDVDALINLENFDCSSNQLTNLEVNILTNLVYLGCSNNKLTELDITELKNLINLSCGYNQLTELNIENLTNLTHLSCSANPLKVLDLKNLTKLTTLYCIDNELTELDVKNLTNLKYLSCSYNYLTELDIKELTKLTELSCFNNNLTTLEVSELINLERLACFVNQLTELDVTNLTKLSFFRCDYNKLPFTSLVSGLGIATYVYLPQNELYYAQSYDHNITLNYSSEANINGTFTTFEFYKDNVLTKSNTTGIFATTVPGKYYCKMTNALFPGLVLITSTITISENIVLSVSPLNLEIGYEANETTSFSISSNTNWTVDCPEEWLSVTPSTGSGDAAITLTADENTFDTPRNAIITVSAAGIDNRIVTLTQGGQNIMTLNELSLINFRLYPNPVVERLNIKLPNNSLPAKVQVFTLNGQEVYSENTGNSLTTIDMNNYHKGAYIIRIAMPLNVAEQKIIKQ